jgi:hypothetical protein
MYSKRMARARDRGPKLTTTVISTACAVGHDVMMRLILGRWPEVSAWPRRSISSRTRSVVQRTSCLGEREPARTSTITWANRTGISVPRSAALVRAATSARNTASFGALPAERPGSRPAAGCAAVATEPGAAAEPATAAAEPGAAAEPATAAAEPAVAAERAAGQAAPWVSQSYGGQPAGTLTSRSPDQAADPADAASAAGLAGAVGAFCAVGPGEEGDPGAGAGGSSWPETAGGVGVRVLDGMFCLPGPENANGRERLAGAALASGSG